MKKRFLFLIALGLMALGATAQETYTVTCTALPTEGGSVTASPTSAGSGQDVTLTVTPNTGYRLGSVSVNDETSGNAVEVTGEGQNLTFSMPTANVTVNASFVKEYAVKQADGIENGTLRISLTTAVEFDNVTITVEPDEGYQLTEGSLKVNDGAVTVSTGSGANEYTFVMPEGDATVTAAFEKIKYAVTADASIANGAIDITTSPVAWGETVSFKVNPDEGYEFVEFSLPDGIVAKQDESDNTKYSFEMPKAAVTIGATFQKVTYTLTLPTVEGGSVTADHDSPVAWDEEVTLTVNPDPGYQLTEGSLKVNDGAVTLTADNKFTMPKENVTVFAAFEKIKYNVKVQVPAGVLAVSNVNPTSPVAWGETVTATVKVAEGYVLQSVKAYQETVKGSNDVSTATEISVADALAKIAELEKNVESTDYYVLTGIVSDWSLKSQKGTFTLTDGDKSIKIYSVKYIDDAIFTSSNALAAGDKVKVYGKLENYNGKTPELLNGYVVEHSVAVAVTEGEGGYSFEMPQANVNIEVETKKLNAITLSILPGNEAGSATLSATSAIEGTEISISEIAAKEGYELGTVAAKQGDVDIELKDYKFTMPDGEVTVTVTFNKLYAISIDTEIANGEVKASKESAVKDSEIALTVTPAKGYQLVEGSLIVTNNVDGGAVEVKDNKFTMPEANVDVSASFEKVNYTISVDEEIEGGKVEVEGALKTAQMGDSVALKATAADEFYTFSKYVVTCAAGDDKGEVEVKENGKFAMPAGIVLVSAEFAKVKFNITIAESENGAVEVAEKSVAWGEEVALTIKPADGYMLDSVIVKQGDTKVEVASNKFTMPKGDVNIEAAFKAGVLVDKTFLNEDFASSQGDFTMNNVSMDKSLSYVWKYNSDYKCMVASAYIKKAYAAESWLISPAINLSNATTATLTFDHAAKFQNGDWEEEFQLMVAKNPSETLDATEWTNLTIPTMPTKGSWTFVSSGEIDLSDYVGEENVRIAFRYVSTTSAADTWEVKNVKVAGKAISDGTDDSDDDSDEIATLDVTCTTVEAYNYEDYYEVGGESILMYIETEDENNGIQFEVITAEGTGIGENALPAGTYEIVDSENAAVGKVISGVYWEDYDQYDGTWWFDYENEMTYSLVSGTVTITETDGVYTIVVDALTEDGGSVKATYTGTVEIEEGEYTALCDIEVMSDVYARDGRIYAEEGARIYTVTGIDVTTLNGQLEGVYVVKNGNKVAKVVVK